MTDQGLVATSNFILNILLARWLIPTEYGAFAVAYTIFIFLTTFHTSMLNEPMLVFGPGKYRYRISTYLRVILMGHWIFCLILCTLFFLTYLALLHFTRSPLTNLFLGLSLASPFILFQWLMRRACYIELQPRLAAFAGFCYMALTFIGALSLRYFESLGPTTTLFIMAIGSLFSGLLIFFKLEVHSNLEINREFILNVLRDHWRYGRWASGTSALAWIPGNLFMLFLPVWWGLEASAAYKAILNLILPMTNATTALVVILLPVLVSKKENPNFGRIVINVSGLIVLAATIYLLLLCVYGETIVYFLYKGNYSEYVGLLWLTGLIPIMGGLIAISWCALQALEVPNKIFLAHVTSSGVALTIGLLFVHAWGVRGAILGLLTAYIVTGTILVKMLAHYIQPSGLKIDNFEK